MSWLIRVVVFYVLTFLFTMVLGGLQEATGFGAGVVILPQWGPGLAALVMLILFRRDGVRLSLGLSGPDLRRVVAAFLVPVGVAAALFAVLRPAVLAPEVALWLLIPGLALGAFGEELGWRGYLHKRLDPALRPLVSSALVGVLWALWHVGLYANGPVYMVFVVLLMIAYSLVLYGLVAERGFNVWIAAAFHLAINVTNLLFMGILTTTAFMIPYALAWMLVAAVVVFARRDLFLRRSRPQAAGETGDYAGPAQASTIP